MRIAFDLDNTLIPFSGGQQFEVESRSFFRRIFKTEPLRLGTIELVQRLKSEGHEIWIYTSSFRPNNNIRKTFLFHGLNLDGIITQKTHDQKLKGQNIKYSKYPPAFGIDLLIDDSEGVGIEGGNGGFRTLIIDPTNKQWTTQITQVISEQRP